MKKVHFRRASVDDALALSRLGRETFIDTFASQNRAEDMDEYVAKTYGEEQQRRELEDPSSIVIIGEIDGRAVAYAWMKRGPAPACVVNANAMEVGRFYVKQDLHGGGIATEMMDLAVAAALEAGAATLWLGVWERNVRAIRFYEKHGFRIVGSQSFLLGSDLQTDFVMVHDLSRRSAFPQD